MLRFYIEVARTAFRRQLIYRWANLAGLVTNIFFGIIFSSVIIALYQARPSVSNYSLRDALCYTWMIQTLIMLILPFGFYDLMLTIRSGAVVSDLSKPYDLYWYWFSREMGRNGYFLLFRAIPIYIAGMLLFNIGLPGNWRFWLLFPLVLLLGAMLGIAYRYLYNVVAFWIVEARVLANFAGGIAFFFTGSYVPLPFFPPWLRTIADWLPFSGLMNLPTEVFMGKLSGSVLWFSLARQLGWVVLLTLLARLLTARAERRVIVQGG